MSILSKEQRNQLSKVVLEARSIAEVAARKALHSLGVDEADAPSHLSPENRTLRRALRAQSRQLGDEEDPRKKGSYDLYHLTEKIAYDQWHRMLFARFLAENDLLIAPQHEVPVSLQECRELAPELGLRDEWDVAIRFAAKILPQIFRPEDPAGKIDLAPEDRSALRDLARIIHGFWKTCEELASFAKRFQSDCRMLKFVQAATTEVTDLVIERGKNAFLENTPALVCCDFLDSGRFFFASGA